MHAVSGQAQGIRLVSVKQVACLAPKRKHSRMVWAF